MLPLLSTLTLLSFGAAPVPLPACAAQTRARFAPLAELFRATAQVREAIGARQSLTEVIPMARRALAAAQRAQPTVQQLACGLDDTHGFDACVSPVIWSCESVPMALDWEAMKGLARTADQEKAWTLMDRGSVDLFSGAPSFAGGCGDSGCAPKSVALPGAMVTGGVLQTWLSLARGDSTLGDAARRAIRNLADTLLDATCVDAERGATKLQLAAMVDELEKFRTGLTAKEAAKVGPPVEALAKALRKGLPKKTCATPGE